MTHTAIEKIAKNCVAFWKISPGRKGCEWDQWLQPDGSGRIAIGWDDRNIGNLSKFKSRKELQGYIDNNRRKWGKDWNRRGRRGGLENPSWYVAQQLWNFFREVKKGEIVVAYSIKTIFAIGKVVGKYDYVKDPDCFSHRKRVKWFVAPKLRISERFLIRKLGRENTLFKVDSVPSVRKVFNLMLQEQSVAS